MLKGKTNLNRLNDSELIEAVKAGKTDAYNELIKRHSSAVFGICLAILGNVHDAEQIFSSVMAAGKTGISEAKIEENTTFRAWISNLACQMSEELFERKIIDKTITKPLSGLDKYEDIVGSKPTDIARLQEGLKKLDIEYRLALVLFYFTGHNSRHVAQSLAISPEQARRIIGHGRGELREIMKELTCQGRNMSKCGHQMQDKIIELVGGNLGANQSIEVQQHINSCPACKEFFNGLREDDRLLSEYAKWAQPLVEHAAETACETIAEEDLKEQLRKKSEVKGALSVNMGKLVTVGGLLLVLLVVAGLFIIREYNPAEPEIPPILAENTDQDNTAIAEEQKPTETSQPAQTSQAEQMPEPAEANVILQQQLQELMTLAGREDIEGLIEMLKAADEPASFVAAAYLGEYGDLRAVEPLQLRSEKNGEPNNPYLQAAFKILERYQEALVNETNLRAEQVNNSAFSNRAEQEVIYGGLVLDSQGNAVENVEVMIYTTSEDVCEPSIYYTDEMGLFETEPMTALNPQTQRIVLFLHSDYAIEWLEFDAQQESGDIAENIEVALKEPSFAAGKIVDSNSQPIEGVFVRGVLRVSKDAESYSYLMLDETNNLYAVSDVNGFFIFENLPVNSRISIEADSNGFAPYRTVGQSEEEVFSIRAGSEDITLTMQPELKVK